MEQEEDAGAAGEAPMPVRNTRSAQRRRAARAGDAALPGAGAATPAEAGTDAGGPVTAGAADPAPLLLDAPAALLALPEPAPVAPDQFSTPTAADPADYSAEERTMDYNAAADTATRNAEQVADAGQAAATDMTGRAQDAMGKASRAFEEMNAFGKGNMEALVESSKIAVKGMETIGQEAADFTRRSFEGATAAMRTLATTRSPAELMKLQGDYARQWFDAVVAETSKSTEMMLKLANDVAQPISNRVALAAEKVRAAA